MKTVLALMAKLIMAMRGHMTRSECKISFCYRERGSVSARKRSFISNNHFLSSSDEERYWNVLNTTELRNFSGSGSLISRGDSSGVLLSNSGKNLERTKDLPRRMGKEETGGKKRKSIEHQPHNRHPQRGVSEWHIQMIFGLILTTGRWDHCFAGLSGTIRQGGGHRIQRIALEHEPHPMGPKYNKRKMCNMTIQSAFVGPLCSSKSLTYIDSTKAKAINQSCY